MALGDSQAGLESVTSGVGRVSWLTGHMGSRQRQVPPTYPMRLMVDLDLDIDCRAYSIPEEDDVAPADDEEAIRLLCDSYLTPI